MDKPSISIASGRKRTAAKPVSLEIPCSKRQALAEITNRPTKQNNKKKNDDIGSIVIASNYNNNVLSNDLPMPPLPPPIVVVVDPRPSVKALFSFEEYILDNLRLHEVHHIPINYWSFCPRHFESVVSLQVLTPKFIIFSCSQTK